jgi:formate hydrogenlyase transcriptional activator
MLAMPSFEVQRQAQGSAAHPSGKSDVNRDLASSDGIVCRSLAMRDTLERIERVAPTCATVLITGETGTGKELVARAVHRQSPRANRPMVAVNVGAIPESLVSSELFGHEQGAFTGAVHRRIGRCEQADRATLFLDEVGELSNEMQVALLRVLQEREFERLGSSQPRRVDIRIIAATNRPLEQDVAQKQFRADLYYRLNVFPIHVPPLRERPEDIPPLANHFLRHNQRRLGRQFAGIEPASLERMQLFGWPGNVRQLENIIEQSMILCDDPLLKVPAMILDDRHLTPGATSRLDGVLEGNERQMIEEALTSAQGRVSGHSGAAERLGLPASTLESKIKRLNIDKLRYRRSGV